jgi:hypothetical protein
MANNRLFIYNKETNEAMLFAYSLGCWELEACAEAINEFLSLDDWNSACSGGPSNLSLLTEDQIPGNVVYFRYDAEQKRKAIESMNRINAMFAPKKHIPFKKKLEERQKVKTHAFV